MYKTRNKISPVAFFLSALLLLTSCQGGIDSVFPKAEKPLPSKLLRKIKDKGMKISSPILLRIFKTENKLEVWKAKSNGRYAFLKDYEICKWSGELGPKKKEGDRQAPEGFYRVTPAQMNPNSKFHLSFNMGFPNAFDRSHGRTGTHLMIHGACSSAGCYSMTDEYVEEIYGLAREAFAGGQKAFQIQAFPFRMTPQNLAKHIDSPHYDFWKVLKEGSDHFEVTMRPPKVDVCERRYIFNKTPENQSKFVASKACPSTETPTSLALAYTKKAFEDQDAFVSILSKQVGNRFTKDSIRDAAKKITPIEKAAREKLKLQQAALVQKQQDEVLEREKALRLKKQQELQDKNNAIKADGGGEAGSDAIEAASNEPLQATESASNPTPSLEIRKIEQPKIQVAPTKKP